MTTRRSPRLAALAAVVLLATLTGCGDEGSSTADDPAATSGAPTAGSPTGSPSGSATTPATTSATPGLAAYAIYDVGSTPSGPRLYREFRSISGAMDLQGALAALTDPPTDPDYRTLWAPGAFSGAAVADGQIDVTLADQTLAARPDDLTAAQARLAVQQVVYTVQAAAQRRLPVRFLLGDAPAATVLGVSTSDPVAAGDELSTLALVEVTTPEQGQTVSGSFTASGVGSSFEGTIAWQVLDGAGAQVLSGSAQTEGDYTSLTPWTATVDATTLPAGDYTFEASTGAAGEGPGPTTDTKAFTVS